MSTPAQIVADNLARVRDRIDSAAEAAGRDPADIMLVGVSKYFDASVAALLVQAGCRDLGEARPQELWAKSAEPELAGVRWHLIGRLQRNKIRRTLPACQLIHSVDSVRLLESIDEVAEQIGLAPEVLLEVNCSGDAAKQGFSADELSHALPGFASLQHARIMGLMTMAPLEGGILAARKSFEALRELRDQLNSNCPPSATLSELSMGMSDDFEAAVAAGATIVRVGSLLFEGLP